MAACFSSERAVLLTEAILDSLSLPALRDRELQIVTSYESTFEWIWQQSHLFSQWLTGDHGTSFWITGLPGSGKSTLLRYIASSPRTHSSLKQWTGGKNVLLASFYFWESGTAMQRSQEGLLRSLLHQLLVPHPEMIPLIFPTLWADLWSASTVERVRRLAKWELLDLVRGFKSFFIGAPSRPICLLVDGLDEFEGDHQITIDMLKGISETGDVKLCISSRPWDVFEEAFRSIPKLALQDLTRGDMMQYTSGQLGGLGLGRGDEKEFDGLIQQIVDKSEGVFLWASQVVKWLLKSKVGTIAECTKKVEDLPSGLDNLYRHQLVDTATEETLIIMSKIVQLMQARETVCRFTRDEDSALVTVWEMVLATRFSVDEVLDLQIQQVPSDKMKEWCRLMVNDIELSTDGLIEVQGEIQGDDTERMGPRSISYIHRTVKDFFSGTTWSPINTHSSSSPHIGLLQSALLSWKYPTSRPRRARAASAWWPTITLAFSHARYAPLAHQDAAFDLLIDMNATLNWYYIGTSESLGEDSWARCCFGTLEQRGKILYEDPFLGLAVKFGLEHFVIRYVRDERYAPGKGRSLLEWATLYLFDRQSSIYPLSSPTIVSTLLDAGSDPNHRLTHRKNGGDGIKTVSLTSPWGSALEALQQGFRRHWISKNPIDIKRWTSILRLLLEHGANTDLVVQATYKDQKEGARALLHKAYTTFPCAETERLWALAC
jgi:hypothetical protein